MTGAELADEIERLAKHHDVDNDMFGYAVRHYLPAILAALRSERPAVDGTRADVGTLTTQLAALAGIWEAQALNREQYEPTPCFELRGCAQALRAALAAAQEG